MENVRVDARRSLVRWAHPFAGGLTDSSQERRTPAPGQGLNDNRPPPESVCHDPFHPFPSLCHSFTCSPLQRAFCCFRSFIAFCEHQVTWYRFRTALIFVCELAFPRCDFLLFRNERRLCFRQVARHLRPAAESASRIIATFLSSSSSTADLSLETLQMPSV
jgi:hypothetical protein